MNSMQTAQQTRSLETRQPEVGLAPNARSRLVVVVQDVEQEAALAARIAELAQRRGLGVLLAGIVPETNMTSDAELRRKLVRVAAFIKDAAARSDCVPGAAGQIMPVDIRMDTGQRWLDAIRFLVRPGDLLACCADWNVGRQNRPLNEMLGAGLHQTVYVFGDLGSPHPDRKGRLSNLAGWIASLLSLGGFCVLGAQIVLATQGVLQSVLLGGAVVIEIGVIYLVNSVLAW